MWGNTTGWKVKECESFQNEEKKENSHGILHLSSEGERYALVVVLLLALQCCNFSMKTLDLSLQHPHLLIVLLAHLLLHPEGQTDWFKKKKKKKRLDVLMGEEGSIKHCYTNKYNTNNINRQIRQLPQKGRKNILYARGERVLCVTKLFSEKLLMSCAIRKQILKNPEGAWWENKKHEKR